MEERTCIGFIEELASSSPTPGGGGAAAMAGAIGVALGSMVGNLTTGKKKYAAVQEDIERILGEAETLYNRLYGLIAKDAEGFEPLAAAYRLPKNTPEEAAYKEAVMQKELQNACDVPLEIMNCGISGLDLLEEMAEKGSVMAVSDAGAGAAILQGAINAASLNVFINAKSLKDRETAEKLLQETENLLKYGNEKAEKIFNDVKNQLCE